MLGHLIYSYNHLDDVRIQQEISRSLYAPRFDGVKMVHVHNGKTAFGYSKYLEDVLIKRKNLGHFSGAADLIDSGMRWFMTHKIKDLRYVLVTAADTWCLDTRFLEGVVRQMENEKKVIACSSWGSATPKDKPRGFSTDFFIIDLEWARKAKIFPLNYPAFKKKYSDFFLMQWAIPIVEMCLQYKYTKFCFETYADFGAWIQREKSWRRLTEREPVNSNGKRRADWSKIGLYTNPDDPRTKKAALQKIKMEIGENAERLKSANDLSYYNKV